MASNAKEAKIEERWGVDTRRRIVSSSGTRNIMSYLLDLIFSHIRTSLQTHLYMSIYIYIHTFMNLHKYIHTYICIYIYILYKHSHFPHSASLLPREQSIMLLAKFREVDESQENLSNQQSTSLGRASYAKGRAKRVHQCGITCIRKIQN